MQLSYYDKRTVLTVFASCAGMEDYIDLAVTIEITVDHEADEAWVEGVKRKDGEHVSQLDGVFGAAEAWLDSHYDDALRGEL
jgi:hypothetical protein